MSKPDRGAMSRREFLAAGGAGLAAAGMEKARAAAVPAKPFALEEATQRDLGARMQAGSLSAGTLAAAYLERMQEIDGDGPTLRSVIEANPDALDIAAALDRERAQGRVRGPLHGIPILVKDNIASGDRMMTTAGSLALEGLHVREDAPLVRRLREAGAVLLGKTNLSEWANFRSSNSLSGWSSRGGQTRNPYALDRSPSGSSSGSAVATAANLCAAAIGTETDGSITSPCACNGLVGLKPTLGLVSRSGIVPIAHSQDTAGPMARSVEDCALLMNAIAGPDPADRITAQKRVPRGIDFTAELGRTNLEGVRLGVGRQFFGAFERADRVIESALAALRDLGAILVDVEFTGLGKFDEAELDVLFHEFKHDLNAWLARYAPDARVKSLADVIAFNEANAARVMPLFGQDLLVKTQASGSLRTAKYLDAVAKCRRYARVQGIDAVVKKHRVDAIVALTSQPAWIVDTVNGDITKGGCTSLAAVSGYPHLTVPAGFAGGLPVGISFFGPAFSDARLLGIGHVFERATRHRRAPRFDASA
jgi:amidase